MVICELCKGAGVRQIAPPYKHEPRDRSVPYASPSGTTRALWPWSVCSCIMNELGALRTALVVGGLLPSDNWTRGLPARGLQGSEPPELSYVVLSTRRDGYRIIQAGDRREALRPDGRRQPIPWGGAGGWSLDLSDAERCLDAHYPVKP